MSSKWHEKKKKIAEFQFERELQSRPDDTTKDIINEAAMGGGDEQVFERKLSKEEKKALAKAKRDAKRKVRKGDEGEESDLDDPNGKQLQTEQVLQNLAEKGNVLEDDGIDHAAADTLAAAGTICTFSASRKGVDARSRDINVQNFTLQHMGTIMLDETEIVLNHGNRYGLIARNGAGSYKNFTTCSQSNKIFWTLNQIQQNLHERPLIDDKTTRFFSPHFSPGSLTSLFFGNSQASLHCSKRLELAPFLYLLQSIFFSYPRKLSRPIQ